MIAGVGLFATGMHAMTADTPIPLAVALLVVGFCNVLTSFSAMRRTRLAWAFSTSINGTLAAVFLFAAPKIRDMTELSLGVAAIPSAFLIVVTTLLAVSAPELETGS